MMTNEPKRQPVVFGKGARTITLENGFKVQRQKGGKYQYRQYNANRPAALRDAMAKANEPADLIADVYAAATKLNESATIETRRQQGR